MQTGLGRLDRRNQQVKRPRLADRVIPCGYCFSRWATTYDHLIPWVYGGTEQKSNLYPCCRRCNSLLGSQIFDTIEDKREYVRNTLIARGKWGDPLPAMREVIQAKEEAPSVLLLRLPLGRLDSETSSIGSSETGSSETPQGISKIERKCGHCLKVFEVHRQAQQYCSTKCRYRAWNKIKGDGRVRRLDKEITAMGRRIKILEEAVAAKRLKILENKS